MLGKSFNAADAEGKSEGAVGKVMPEPMKAEQHRKMAEPKGDEAR